MVKVRDLRLNKDFAFQETILASQEAYFDFLENSDTDKYAPFKNVQVLNTGTEDIQLYINGSNGYKLVPAGTIFERTDKEITTMRLVNTSAVNSADVTITLDNDISEKEYLKALVLGIEELKIQRS